MTTTKAKAFNLVSNTEQSNNLRSRLSLKFENENTFTISESTKMLNLLSGGTSDTPSDIPIVIETDNITLGTLEDSIQVKTLFDNIHEHVSLLSLNTDIQTKNTDNQLESIIATSVSTKQSDVLNEYYDRVKDQAASIHDTLQETSDAVHNNLGDTITNLKTVEENENSIRNKYKELKDRIAAVTAYTDPIPLTVHDINQITITASTNPDGFESSTVEGRFAAFIATLTGDDKLYTEDASYNKTELTCTLPTEVTETKLMDLGGDDVYYYNRDTGVVAVAAADTEFTITYETDIHGNATSNDLEKVRFVSYELNIVISDSSGTSYKLGFIPAFNKDNPLYYRRGDISTSALTDGTPVPTTSTGDSPVTFVPVLYLSSGNPTTPRPLYLAGSDNITYNCGGIVVSNGYGYVQDGSTDEQPPRVVTMANKSDSTTLKAFGRIVTYSDVSSKTTETQPKFASLTGPNIYKTRSKNLVVAQTASTIGEDVTGLNQALVNELNAFVLAFAANPPTYPTLAHWPNDFEYASEDNYLDKRAYLRTVLNGIVTKINSDDVIQGLLSNTTTTRNDILDSMNDFNDDTYFAKQMTKLGQLQADYDSNTNPPELIDVPGYEIITYDKDESYNEADNASTNKNSHRFLAAILARLQVYDISTLDIYNMMNN